jgi:hypothetical protein
MKRKLCDEKNHRMEMKRNEPETRLMVHPAQKIVRERSNNEQRRDSTGTEERRGHPHFAQFEGKAY